MKCLPAHSKCNLSHLSGETDIVFTSYNRQTQLADIYAFDIVKNINGQILWRKKKHWAILIFIIERCVGPDIIETSSKNDCFNRKSGLDASKSEQCTSKTLMNFQEHPIHNCITFKRTASHKMVLI